MPILEERMIYRVGKSSLAITLPQNWLKFFGLTAGDIVEVTGNGDLTIRPRNREKQDTMCNPSVAQIGNGASRELRQDKEESV